MKQTIALPEHDRPNFYPDVPTGYRWSGPGLVAPERPCSFITHFSSSLMDYPSHDGLLSIKTARFGREIYETDVARHAVDDDCYLILNSGHPYACSIHNDTGVESFCIFFRPGVAEEVLGSLVTPADRLLDSLQGSVGGQPVQFFERCHPHDEIVTPHLRRLKAASVDGSPSSGWLEEQFHLLLESMLCAHRSISKEIEALPHIRYATRVEIYQRLHRARDFMDASLSEPLTLLQIAATACFSQHHFLRLFSEVFGITPHRYLTQRRIERARHLLAESDRAVTDICFDVGFESLGSFSSLFHRLVGLSPTQYRKTGCRVWGVG